MTYLIDNEPTLRHAIITSQGYKFPIGVEVSLISEIIDDSTFPSGRKVEVQIYDSERYTNNSDNFYMWVDINDINV